MSESEELRDERDALRAKARESEAFAQVLCGAVWCSLCCSVVQCGAVCCSVSARIRRRCRGEGSMSSCVV